MPLALTFISINCYHYRRYKTCYVWHRLFCLLDTMGKTLLQWCYYGSQFIHLFLPYVSSTPQVYSKRMLLLTANWFFLAVYRFDFLAHENLLWHQVNPPTSLQQSVGRLHKIWQLNSRGKSLSFCSPVPLVCLVCIWWWIQKLYMYSWGTDTDFGWGKFSKTDTADTFWLNTGFSV